MQRFQKHFTCQQKFNQFGFFMWGAVGLNNVC